MSLSSKTLQSSSEESRLSEVFSSIKHLFVPSCAVRRNPWHVECGFKELLDAATSSVLLNNTMPERSDLTVWDDCVKPVETLWRSPLINQSEVRSNAPPPTTGWGKMLELGNLTGCWDLGAMFVWFSYDYIFHFDFLIT